MSESWHPRKTEKDVAVARAGVAKYDRGWKYGAGTREHDHSEPGKGGEVLNPEQVYIGTLDNRPEVLEESKTVTVDPSGGADYTSIQDAFDNEAPIRIGKNEANLTIDLADGTYSEDVLLHNVFAPGNGKVKIVGNATTPANVKIDTISLTNCWGPAPIVIDGVQITSEPSPYFQSDEDGGITAYGTSWIPMYNLDFANTTKAVVAYAAQISLGQSIDVGGLVGPAFAVKHGGRLQTAGATDVTGTVTNEVYTVPSGVIIFDSSHSVSGSGLVAHSSEKGWALDKATRRTYGLGGDRSSVRAYMSADQTITVAGGADNVQFDTVKRDRLGEWDASTYTFTAQEAGVYSVSVNLRFSPTADGDKIFVTLQHSDYDSPSPFFANTSGAQCFVIHEARYLDAGETLNVGVNPQTNDCTILGSLNVPGQNFICIERIK